MGRLRSTAGGIKLALVTAVVGASLLPAMTSAEPFATDVFERTWQRTDKPVSDLAVSRTWIWGPEAFTTGLLEPYDEGPNGKRLVQYYDKTRMEITTDPDVSQDSVWHVTNGLLAHELITGELQLGDDHFESHAPAAINIAGDAEDGTAPTYASFKRLLDLQTYELDSIIGATVDRDGNVGNDPSMLEYGVTAQAYVQETDHTVASVFWDFMISEGTIYQNGGLAHGSLFENAFFATGLPITEAYWDTILIDGQEQDVLIQAFERRVLTYTPSNPEGWKVEAGNVGLHYHQWRYEILPGASPNVPAAERGTIGEAGKAPLGEDAFSPAAQPYLDVPVSGEMSETVASRSDSPALYMRKNVSLYIANTPSNKVYFVVDYNDGTLYVSPVMGDNFGHNAIHTWRGPGTYHGKAWAIDPITGVRSEITEFTIVID